MIVMNSFQDMNKLCLFWFIENDEVKFKKKGLDLLNSLICHEGQGSIFNCLKQLNYASCVETDSNTEIKTAFKMYSVEIELTQSGTKNYQKVIAIIFEYLRLLKEEWLAQPTLPSFFEE